MVRFFYFLSISSVEKTNKIAISKVIESLLRFMKTPSDSITVTTTIESLKWVLHLVNKQPEAVENYFSFLEIFVDFP